MVKIAIGLIIKLKAKILNIFDFDDEIKYAYGNPIIKHNNADTIPIHSDLPMILQVLTSLINTNESKLEPWTANALTTIIIIGNKINNIAMIK
ncbi:hypothetical protein [Mycoplasma sp. CSL7491-lung]|uniref:hypothetical protein n=1 Tax=Mycoplasma sp. CSL7491-lung TaxID=549718 RepID=UPI0035BE73FA